MRRRHARTGDMTLLGSLFTDFPKPICSLVFVHACCCISRCGRDWGFLVGAIIAALYAARAFRMQRSEFCEALKKNAADIQFIQLQTNHIRESLAEMSR